MKAGFGIVLFYLFQHRAYLRLQKATYLENADV